MTPATRSGPTDPRRPQREALLTGVVEYVLANGVSGLSLRPLAAALGTSDRMLLYYFETRDRLLVAALDAVGEQLRDALSAALPTKPVAPARLLTLAWQVAQEPAAEPHLRLYVEVSGLAARGQEPFRTAAEATARTWVAWVEQRLDLPRPRRRPAALGVLAVIDGLLLTRFTVGRRAAGQAARWLGAELAGRGHHDEPS